MYQEGAWIGRRKCAVFTADARLTGSLRTKRRRLVDALHELHEPLIALHEAEMEPLVGPATPSQVYPTALVRVSDVVVCYPLEPAAVSHRRGRAAAGIREEQIVSQVVLQAKGITVSGDVHLPPDTTLMGYVTSRNNAFLPMTGVTVAWGAGSASVDDALVNCEMVSAFYTQTESLAFLLGQERHPTGARRPTPNAHPTPKPVWTPSTFDPSDRGEGRAAAH